MPLIDYFPKELQEPRQQQREALTFMDNAFNDNVNIICLELSVGAGKSGVAMALSRAFGGGIVACPTVQLQAQYINDFDNCAPLLGRSRFPCIQKDTDAVNFIPSIRQGKIPVRPIVEMSCAHAPCLNKPRKKQERIRNECDMRGGCTYQHSLDYAQDAETIVANLHSLMYSVAMSERITPRKVLIIDEAHDLEKFMRGFLTIKFKIRRVVDHQELKSLKTTDHWIRWLQNSEQMDLLTSEEQRDSYLARLERLDKLGDSVTNYWNDEKDSHLWIDIIPVNVGGACRTMLFSLAEKVILMSGTIYNKDIYLRPLGIDSTKAAFLRLPSDFPAKNRQVVLPRNRTLDLSHKNWEVNLPQAIKDITAIFEAHPNEKGIIHTNSYKMSLEIANLLGDRVMGHKPEDFHQRLKEFYEITEPKVFISPVCSQGVDFKDDLARFQIIVRPAFGAINDPFTKFLLDNSRWDVYNYDAVKTFGQTLGRVVRSKTDWGTTYLLSSTFLKLIQNTSYLLPLWVKQSFVK